MPIIDVSGLVIGESGYGESSKILTVLAKDTGKIKIFASHVKKPNSGSLLTTRIFSYTDFVLFKGKPGSLMRYNEGEAVHTFPNISLSVEKTAYAAYFCEVTDRLCKEGVEENEQLSLLLNMLYSLDKTSCSADDAVKLRAVFQLRAMAVAGYAPNCGNCMGCSSAEIAYFNYTESGFLCKDCREKAVLPSKENPYPAVTSPVTPPIIKAVKFIVGADSKNILAFDLGKPNMEYLAELGEFYVSGKLEHKFKSLEYLKTLLSFDPYNLSK